MIKKMNFQRMLLLLFCVGLIGLSVGAANVQLLRLTVMGTAITIPLSDLPSIIYQNDEIVITGHDEKGTYVQTFPVKNVQSMGFDTDPTAIVGTKERPTKRFAMGKVYFEGLKPNSVVEVYGTDGTLLKRIMVSVDGEAEVEYGSLPKGVYVVCTSNHIFKITNK